MNNQICASHGGTGSSITLLPRAVQGPRKALLSTIEGAVTRLFDLVRSWHESARTRRALARLDDYMLRDIGVSRASVEQKVPWPFGH